jgi:RNase P/RNase MRP subunit POP5
MVRIKNRYIIGQIMLPSQKKKGGELIDSKPLILMKDLQSSLKDKVAELFGEIGAGEFGNSTVIKYFDSENSLVFVVRMPRESEQQVHMAISCVTAIRDKTDLVLRSLHVKSCPRTCTAALKETMIVYYSSSTNGESIPDLVDKQLADLDL